MITEPIDGRKAKYSQGTQLTKTRAILDHRDVEPESIA